MKKYLMIAVGVLGVGAAGWSGLWFYGKSELERRMELEAAKIEAQGWTVTWGTREIDGFPVGYRMRLGDVAAAQHKGGQLIRMPDLVAEVDASDPDRLIVSLPPEFTVDLPISEDVRAKNSLLPPIVKMTVRSENARVLSDGLDPALAVLMLTADRIGIEVDQDDFEIKAKGAMEAVEGRIAPHEKGRVLSVKAAAVTGDALNMAEPSEPLMVASYDNLTLTSVIAARSLRDLIERLATDPETLIDGAFQTAGQTIVLSLNAAENAGSALTYTAGAQTGLFAVGEGKLTYQAEERELNARLSLPEKEAAPAQIFTARAEAYQRRFAVPLVLAAPKPQEGSMKLALINVVGDDNVWKVLDTGQNLPRDPAQLELDLVSTLRFTGARQGLPVEFSNVSVNALSLDAAGAKARVAGDVEILQPINLPLGKLDIKLTGAEGLVDKLAKAAWITESMSDIAKAMLKVYARPVDGQDRHETEVEFSNEGISMNGLRLPLGN